MHSVNFSLLALVASLYACGSTDLVNSRGQSRGEPMNDGAASTNLACASDIEAAPIAASSITVIDWLNAHPATYVSIDAGSMQGVPAVGSCACLHKLSDDSKIGCGAIHMLGENSSDVRFGVGSNCSSMNELSSVMQFWSANGIRDADPSTHAKMRSLTKVRVSCQLPPEPKSSNPIKIIARPVSASQLDLSWSPGSNATGYILAMAQGRNAPTTCAGGSDIGNVLNTSVKNLKAKSTYSFRICAYNQSAQSSGAVIGPIKTPKK
jgi:hypothetical protein